MNWRTNIYEENKWAGIGHNPLIQDPDSIDEGFVETANKLLSNGVEMVRQLIPSHQSAIAIIINKDWKTVRKFFRFRKNMRSGNAMPNRPPAMAFTTTSCSKQNPFV